MRAITETSPKVHRVLGRSTRCQGNKIRSRHCIRSYPSRRNLPLALIFEPLHAASSTVRKVSLPSTSLAQSAEYSGTSSQVDASTVSGSDVTRIESELAAPPIIFHSPLWKS